MIRLFTFLSMAVIIASCGPTLQEYDTLLAQKQELETEVLNLKQVIENYENTPDRLYSAVSELVTNKDIDGLSALCFTSM